MLSGNKFQLGKSHKEGIWLYKAGTLLFLLKLLLDEAGWWR
jgi:hypothetical protein